jgi:hypothetical protein
MRVVVAVVLGAVFAWSPGSTFASHAGVTVDCGDAGSFTARAVQTAAGDHQAPEPSSITVFEEGGTLTVMSLVVNGQPRFAIAATGLSNNAVTEVTCSYTTGAGLLFEVTGILTAR